MAAIFRDARGTLRHNTVPARFVRPEAWERYRAEGAAQLRAPFAELIAKTHEPFLTKIGDSRCTDGPVFCAGRVLLVGDALTALRPHTGFGAEMAAYQCNLLGEVLRGERSLASWASDVQNMADKASRLSVAVGLFGLGSWYQFLRALTSLFLFWFADRKPDRKTPSAGSGGERKSGRGSKE